MSLVPESCPLCGSELSKAKFSEIQTKLQQEQRQQLADQKTRMAEAVATLRHNLEKEHEKEIALKVAAAHKAAEKTAAEQLKKLQAERDAADRAVRESEAREEKLQASIEKEKTAAAEAAKREAAAELKKMTQERDLATKRLNEAEAREVEIRKEAQKDTEAKLRKEFADSRAALERDKTLALMKQETEFNREREAQQKKLRLMEQQIQKKRPNELGDGAEIDVYEALKAAFPDDSIRRVPKGVSGADIIFEPRHNGQLCGKIVIDSKNRQGWQNAYITKLREDQVQAKADHAILSTTVFPAGKKELCIEDGVIVVSPGRVVHIVEMLRHFMVSMHKRGLSFNERADKMNRLYKLITSEAYAAKFKEAERITEEILELDVSEKKAHDIMWRKRGSLATRLGHVLRDIDTDVAGVVEASDHEASPPPKGVKAVSAPIPDEEKQSWNKQ